MAANDTTPASSNASASDVMSTLKNIVLALNNIVTTYLNVQGQVNAANIGTPTVVSPKAGRITSVSVITAGTTNGVIFDGASLTANTKPVFVIPNTVGVFVVNLPLSFGLLVNPGAGQTVTVSYS
jgi:hypothetical protein